MGNLHWPHTSLIIMCAQLKDVTDSDWQQHKKRVAEIDERITEVERVAYSSRNWLRTLGVIFIAAQGLLTYMLVTPNSNEKAIIKLTQLVEANTKSDEVHHNDHSKHIDVEILRDKFVPTPEQRERDKAQDARQDQLRSDMKEGFTRIENQSLRQQQELAEQRQIMIQVLQEVKK